FFNPALGLNVSKTVQLNSSGAQSATTADGPTSVIFGYLYQEGSVIFGELNPATLPPLPAGYSALNNKAYSVTTDTVFSGQETVTFSAGSVSDPAVFSNLRILQTEVDPLDPAATIWVDRTILAPDPQAPNYGTRTINAAVSALGNFLIAIQSPNTNTSSADLSVTGSHSPEPVAAENDLTFTSLITNNGPQIAINVGLIDGFSHEIRSASISPSQGSCKFVDGSAYCKLGNLASGATATVSIIVKPTEGAVPFPPQGESISSSVFV